MFEILDLILLCLQACLTGCLAWVYAVKLTEPNMIFSKLYDLLSGLPDWLYFPLIGCGYCVSGQLGFWSYFFIMDNYSIVHHAWYIGLTIFIYHLISSRNERN